MSVDLDFLTTISDEIIPQSTRKKIADVSKTFINSTNFLDYKGIFNQTLLDFNLQDISDGLTSLANYFDSQV